MARAVREGRAGYLDTYGSFVIAPGYDLLDDRFSDGPALIRHQGKYGYVGPDGRIAIQPRYLEATRFSEGLAGVAVDVSGQVKWGFINDSERSVFEPKYERAGIFLAGLALVKADGKWQFLGRMSRKVDIGLDALFRESVAEFRKALGMGLTLDKVGAGMLPISHVRLFDVYAHVAYLPGRSEQLARPELVAFLEDKARTRSGDEAALARICLAVARSQRRLRRHENNLRQWSSETGERVEVSLILYHYD